MKLISLFLSAFLLPKIIVNKSVMQDTLASGIQRLKCFCCNANNNVGLPSGCRNQQNHNIIKDTLKGMTYRIIQR